MHPFMIGALRGLAVTLIAFGFGLAGDDARFWYFVIGVSGLLAVLEIKDKS